MASNECYHFTKLNRAHSIARTGLVPRLETNSQAVSDSAAKISFSDGKLAAIGLFANFYGVYSSMKGENPTRRPTDINISTSKDIEDYLGKGIYLVFDGTNIENTGGNKGQINPFDAATRTPILPESLSVCILKDENGNTSYSQYDFVKYLIANLTPQDYETLAEMDTGHVILPCLEAYKAAYKEELEHFSSGKYSTEVMSLSDFSNRYKEDINIDIQNYLETYSEVCRNEISRLRSEFQHMPLKIQTRLSHFEQDFEQKLEAIKNSDLSALTLPLPGFYDSYKSSFEEFFNQYCSDIVSESQPEIATLRAEVENMPEYQELFLHSSHHVANVTEFAYIIGKAEGTLGDDLDLLVQAAKYHDSGREASEWVSDNHADPSAEHAALELSKTGKYSPEQIAMIKVAIRYHEHGEMYKNQFDNQYFSEVAALEGVPSDKLEHAKLMCIYLKDADALDRVRLGNLDTNYLRTTVAKSTFFLREFGKAPENISWENAGLALKRNQDFNLELQLKKAFSELKKAYENDPEISQELLSIEQQTQNIHSLVKKVRKNPVVIQKLQQDFQKKIEPQKSGSTSMSDITKEAITSLKTQGVSAAETIRTVIAEMSPQSSKEDIQK